jgi:transcriptional antiterminator NusG
MIMNDDTWYVVRNTRGVTAFVGPGSKPVALTEKEILSMGIEFKKSIDIFEGDTVKVISGPFEESIGVIKEINEHKQIVIVMLSIFGRDTPVELNFLEIEKL